MDVLIAGAGFAGLALAIALRQSLEPAFSVAIADPSLAGAHSEDSRASAIAASARRLFAAIGVWDAIAAEAQPILDMVITDSRLADAVRPTFLSFAGEIEPGEPFAHMVENRHLTAALIASAREHGVELRPTAVAGFEVAPAFVAVRLSDGAAPAARLLVAADGARSRLRALAGIATHGWSYAQTAIVATVAHERDHGGRAVEHFLPAGPFAILPLTGRRSSIAWTEERNEAARLIALPDALFKDELGRRFGLELGELELVGRRQSHPLGLYVARSFVADRLALVGDAAHVIHPIAGLGLNLGLRDAAALVECVADAVALGLDPGGDGVLEAYARWRRFDTMMTAAATDGLNRLFSNNDGALRAIRDLGLRMVDSLGGLKNLFMREAAGETGRLPKLLQGEPV
jgi:2-octaprenyl-6-methoxyphenol hydroxylase